jgi:hypothetical protein
MVDQVTFDIGGGVSAGASVVQLVQGMLTGARSVTVEVDNNTDLTLILCGQHHDHGGWAKIPERKIGPYQADPKGCTDVFGSQNRGGSVMTGTEGWVSYHGHKAKQSNLGPVILRFTVKWDNPYLSLPWNDGNSANAWLTMLDGSKVTPYKVRYVVGAGNTLAPFKFMLFPANQIPGDLVQDITDWTPGR